VLPEHTVWCIGTACMAWQAERAGSPPVDSPQRNVAAVRSTHHPLRPPASTRYHQTEDVGLDTDTRGRD